MGRKQAKKTHTESVDTEIAESRRELGGEVVDTGRSLGDLARERLNHGDVPHNVSALRGEGRHSCGRLHFESRDDRNDGWLDTIVVEARAENAVVESVGLRIIKDEKEVNELAVFAADDLVASDVEGFHNPRTVVVRGAHSSGKGLGVVHESRVGRRDLHEHLDVSEEPGLKSGAIISNELAEVNVGVTELEAIVEQASIVDVIRKIGDEKQSIVALREVRVDVNRLCIKINGEERMILIERETRRGETIVRTVRQIQEVCCELVRHVGWLL